MHLSIITILLSGLIFISLYLGINYFSIYVRLRWDRKHLLFSIMCFAAVIYIICTLLEYMTSSPDVYFSYIKVQMLAVPLFFVPMIWLVSIYTGKLIKKLNVTISIAFILFAVIRLFHPTALTISGVRGMKPWLLPWNEIIWLVDGNVNGWGLVYYVLLLFLYIAVCYYLVVQYRRGEQRRAMMLLVAVVLFLAANINDIVVSILQIRWVFLSEFGFVGFIAVMSSQLSGEIIRLANVEKKLEETEMQRRAIFNSMFLFTGLLDKEGHIVDVNEAALKFIGSNLDELRGKLFWEAPWWANLPAEKEKLQKAVIRAASGEFVRYETANHDAEGQLYMIDFSLNPVQDEKGSVIYIVPEGRDISQLRDAEKTILQNNLELTALNEELNATIEEMEATNEEFEAQNQELISSQAEVIQRTSEYRNLFELAGDAILVIKEEKIIDCNSRALEYFGYSRANLAGREMTMLSPGRQPDGTDSRAEENDKLIMARGGSLQQYEWYYLRSDGATFPAEVTLKSIEFDTGVHLQAIIRDISERKGAEEEKEHIQSQLAHAQKMEAVGTLAGGLAHDFNNILSGIMGSLNMLQIILAKESLDRGEDIEKYLEMGMEASRRSADIVGQLLSFSRKEEFELVYLDINLSLKHVEKICSNSFPKSVALDFRTAGTGLNVKGDPVQIEQMLLNLAVNGSHAMTIMRREKEPQGGTLTVYGEIRKPDADETLNIPGYVSGTSYVVVRVQDTGVGMAPGDVEKIFEPFYTTKEKDIGTGLGLAMTFNIVRQHGGFIRVESEIGKGAAFMVYLPLAENGDRGAQKKPEKSCLVEGTGHVLVVDDEKYLLKIAGAILEECGYQVTVMNRPEDAVSFFQREYMNIDGVILDLNMPGMSGIQVFSAMKEIDPSVRCMLASGQLEDDLVQEADALGVADFIKKPYSAESLSERVEQLVL